MSDTTATPPETDPAEAEESVPLELDDDGAAERAARAQALLDAVRTDTEHLRAVRRWLDGALEREARLTAYLAGDWLEDRDLLLTAGAAEGDLDLFGEDTALEDIARAQAARRALHHALQERAD